MIQRVNGVGIPAHPEADFCQFLDDPLHALVVRAELDLAWEVKNDISVRSELAQAFLQPVKVGLEILHAVQHAAVWAQPVLVHDILESDQRRNVDRAWIGQGVVCGVEVHY